MTALLRAIVESPLLRSAPQRACGPAGFGSSVRATWYSRRTGKHVRADRGRIGCTGDHLADAAAQLSPRAAARYYLTGGSSAPRSRRHRLITAAADDVDAAVAARSPTWAAAATRYRVEGADHAAVRRRV